MADNGKFTVTWEAEHVPETHRTLNSDHTVTVAELPGTVNLYAVINGGRILMDVLHGGKVLEAIQTAQQQAEQQRQDAAQQQATQQPPEPAQQQQPVQPAPEQPQG